jgi:hypothetical protein
MGELQLQQKLQQLHELIECYDWEGVIELLQHGSDDGKYDEEEEEATRRAAHALASQENSEGHLALHSSELYQPGALMEAIEAVVDAYPEALTTPKSSSDPSEMGIGSGVGMYPLHICLDTMLENQASPGDESQDAGCEAYYFEIVKMLLQRAPQVAHYATPFGVLPLHYAAQLHIDGLVELLLQAYPQGASQLTQHTNALPLHLACQYSSKSTYFALPILQLLFAYPAGAQVQDCASLEDEDDYDIDMEDDSVMPMSRFPLHHVCANRDLLWMMEGSHDATLVQLLHQAHPEAALKLDHRGRSPLSLVCQHSNSITNMEALVYLLEQASSHQCAVVVDSRGRLPLHYLAESIASGSVNGTFIINQVWKMLVSAHPQALFHKDCQDQHTPVSLLLLHSAANAVGDSEETILQTSFDCCCVSSSTPPPLSHVLAFFAMALHPTSGQRMALLQQAMRGSLFGSSIHANMNININVDSKGNNMLHIACMGLHWSGLSVTEVEQLHEANKNDSLSMTTGQQDSLEQEVDNLTFSVHQQMSSRRKNTVAPVSVNVEHDCDNSIISETSSSSSHCSSTQGGWAQVLDLIVSAGGCNNNLVEMPNVEGQLPLHLLLTNPTSTSSVVTQQAAQRLVRAYPESASLQDPTTGLVPFMSAASADTTSTTTTATFELLQDLVAVSDLSSMAFSVLTAKYGGVSGAGSRSKCTTNADCNADVKRCLVLSSDVIGRCRGNVHSHGSNAKRQRCIMIA